jgi:glycosyltransferase involved in cell wall biosynthesis
MSLKNKIVFLTLDITLVGGVERMLVNLTKFLSSETIYDVEIVSFFKSHASPQFNFDNINIIYTTHSKFNISNLFNSLKSYFSILISIIFLKAKNNEIYVSTFPNISVLFLILKRNKNLIVTEHAEFNAHNIYFNSFRKRVYRYAKIITVLTKNQKDIFDKFCNPEIVYVVPNPILKQVVHSNRNNNYIITIGRLVEVKGFEYFINAISILSKDFPDISAYIIGDGPELIRLSNLIKELNLSSNLNIINNETDIYKYLIQSSVFVVTSLTESFGMAILESLSVGLPVVAFDAGDGPKNLIKNEYNGFLIPFADTNLLANKIKYIYTSDDDNWHTFSKNALLSSKSFEVDNVIHKWNKIFEKFV